MKKLVWAVLIGAMCLMMAGCSDDTGQAVYTISGKVYSAGETKTGMPGVTIDLDGDLTMSTTTDTNGAYSFIVPNGRYRIAPTKKSTTFNPPDNVFYVNDANVSGMDIIEELFGSTPAANTWKSTGSMATERAEITLATLSDGRVLVAGGDNRSGSLNSAVILGSAEIYDPTTGKWSTTGSMVYERVYHTLTTLRDGRVLVAGGMSNKRNVRASAEIYDPATGQWTVTGSLNYERKYHTATLLPDGRVLVAGGEADSGNLRASAEIFDPATGQWTATGSMAYNRYYHTMILLHDGMVLVAGGYSTISTTGGRSLITNTELYNPTTGQWTATGSLNIARKSHAMTLMAFGRVLIAGGEQDSSSATIKPTALTSTEIYTPSSGKWEKTGSLNYERYDHTMSLLPNGKLMVAGGFSQKENVRASAETFDPATGQWTATGSLNYERTYHAMTPLSGGKVLIVGGMADGFLNLTHFINSGGIRASAELFYPGD